MPADVAFDRLTAELARLRGLLKAVRLGLRATLPPLPGRPPPRRQSKHLCPDPGNKVPAELYDAGPEWSDRLRKATAAARLAGAAAADGGGAVSRAALIRCERHLGELRQQVRTASRGLTDLGRRTDLTPRKAWAAWVDELSGPVRAAARQAGTAAATAADCWRELADRPAAGGIVITNVAVAGGDRGRRTSGWPNGG